MTEQETEDVMAALLATFETVRPQPSKESLLVWKRMVASFPREVCLDAIVQLVESRDPYRIGKFPTLDEFTPIADRIWSAKHVASRSEQTRLEQRPAATLLSGPVEAWGERDSLPAVAVRLVRDLCEGTINPGSEEHTRRQAEVEAMARVAVSPCCDQDGLVTYIRRAGDYEYRFTGRCPCPRGQASRYTGYPVIDPQMGRVAS